MKNIQDTNGLMATVTQTERAQSMAPSAAAPSPFTPIADYGFLSNCHTGALVAPDGLSHLALVEAAARIIVAETVTELAAEPGREPA